LNGYAFADAAAPSLAIGHATWSGSSASCLKGIDAQILKSGTDLEYLANFLEMEAARYVRTGDIQDALVALLRTCLQAVRLVDVRQHRKIFKRIVQLLSPDRIFAFGPQDHAAKGAIPEALYRTLLNASTRALPVPGDLGPDGVTAITSDADLGAWLDAMMRHDLSESHSGGVTKTQLLDASERVIRAAGDEARQISLLRQCSRLKVLRAYKGADGDIEGVSLAELTESHGRGWLFKVSDPNRPLGFVQKLARALPEIRVFVVRSTVASYVDGVREDGLGRIPSSEDPRLFALSGCTGDAAAAWRQLAARRPPHAGRNRETRRSNRHPWRSIPAARIAGSLSWERCAVEGSGRSEVALGQAMANGR
jgi:hypothetical protein